MTAPGAPRKMKTCEQCYEEYEAGTGTSEDHGLGRIRLTERFCTDSCADAYNDSFKDEE